MIKQKSPRSVRSHRCFAWLEPDAVGVGAGLPAMGCTAAPAIPRKTVILCPTVQPKSCYILKKKRFDLPIMPSYDFILNFR